MGFTPLLQQGVGVRTRTGISLREFVCDVIELSPEYLETRIQTLFLDGRAVDDVDAAIIENGAVVALSAAMPGLLGATLRRGSYYSAMRGEISYKKAERPASAGEGVVLVKLFNLLVREVGPILLSRGVWIRGRDLHDFFSSRSSRFWQGCKGARLDDEDVTPAGLARTKWGEGSVLVQVKAPD